MTPVYRNNILPVVPTEAAVVLTVLRPMVVDIETVNSLPSLVAEVDCHTEHSVDFGISPFLSE